MRNDLCFKKAFTERRCVSFGNRFDLVPLKPTIRAQNQTMPTRPSLLSFLLCTFLCSFLFGRAYCADESLYDASHARELHPGEFSLFGPQSSHFRYDSRMIHAAQIAADRAHVHSTSRCWHYVKDALIAANAVDSRPKTEYAKEAGAELQSHYGFKRLKVTNPWEAPVGAVLVYGGRGAGHVEIRTASGFVSDFTSPKPSPRPLLGVYVKPPA